MSLKVQLEHLEEKIAVLTERINQGDEWKRHLECWMLNHLGMSFPAHLSVGTKGGKPNADDAANQATENNNDAFKENEENQFSSLIKFRTKRPPNTGADGKKEVKVYQKKKRISATTNNDKSAGISGAGGGVGTSSSSGISSSGSSSSIVMKAASDPQSSAATELTTTTTSYIITPTEIVQSPANEIEIDNVKYEPAETEESQEPVNAVEMNVNAVNVGEAVIAEDQAPIQEEARYRIQEENNVLHIIKIEAGDPLSADGEHAVINYSDALPIVQLANVQHDNNSQLSSNLVAFSGPLGEETAIGFLNPDGSVTPCRPNVIISAGSGLTAGAIQQFNVVQAAPAPPGATAVAVTTVPAPPTATVTVPVTVSTPAPAPAPQTPPKPVDNSIDPKGTFVCNICENTFQGLYLFRQHEKKSECRRIAKKLKKSDPPAPPSPAPSYLKPAESSYLASSGPNLTSPVLNTPILKYKCSICGSCYASEAYLRFHLSKVHNRTPD